jgi:hypothetical protein
MTKTLRAKRRFVLCVDNSGYPASLETRKIYRILPDPAAGRKGLARVIDESGQDYLYPRSYFVPIELPKAASELFRLAS